MNLRKEECFNSTVRIGNCNVCRQVAENSHIISFNGRDDPVDQEGTAACRFFALVSNCYASRIGTDYFISIVPVFILKFGFRFGLILLSHGEAHS